MPTMTDEYTSTLPSIDDHAAQFTQELLGQAIMLAARDRAQAAAGMIEVRDLAQRIKSMSTEVDLAKNDAKSYHAVETVLARVRGEARPGTPADELISKIIDQREAYYGFMNEARDGAQAIVRDRDTAMTLMRLRDDSYPTCEESARALIAKFDQVTEHGRRAASDLAKARFDAECYRGQLGVETERLAKLEALARSAASLLRKIRPNVLAQGGDQSPNAEECLDMIRQLDAVKPVAPKGVDIAAVMRDGVGPDAAPAGTPVASTIWCGVRCDNPECKWVTVHIAPVDPAEFAREFQGCLHQRDTSPEGWKTWAEFKPVEQREIVSATRHILEAKGIPVTVEKPATSPNPSGDVVAAAGAAAFARPAPVEVP